MARISIATLTFANQKSIIWNVFAFPLLSQQQGSRVMFFYLASNVSLRFFFCIKNVTNMQEKNTFHDTRGNVHKSKTKMTYNKKTFCK